MVESSGAAPQVRMRPETKAGFYELTGFPEGVDAPIVFARAEQMLRDLLGKTKTKGK